jgi:hypothetical protein
MLENENTLNASGKVSYNVPEGYFKNLRSRLEAIPAMNGQSVGTLQRMTPYLAMAACFLAAVLIGNAVLRSTATETIPQDLYNEMTMADLFPVTDSDEVYMTAGQEQDTLSEEDVIDYLIVTGISPEMIEYTRLVAQK